MTEMTWAQREERARPHASQYASQSLSVLLGLARDAAVAALEPVGGTEAHGGLPGAASTPSWQDAQDLAQALGRIDMAMARTEMRATDGWRGDRDWRHARAVLRLGRSVARAVSFVRPAGETASLQAVADWLALRDVAEAAGASGAAS